MKQKLTFLLLLFACLSSIAGNKEYEVFGPQGGLSMVVTLPKGFDTQTGKCPMVILMHGIFSSKDYNPMPFIRCWGIMKLGREYLIDTQKLDIYGTAAGYDNPVCILHGTKFVETYGDRSKLTMIEGENHMITQRRKETVAHCIAFFKELFER